MADSNHIRLNNIPLLHPLPKGKILLSTPLKIEVPHDFFHNEEALVPGAVTIPLQIETK